MVDLERPTVQLESWDGSNFTVSVVGTNEVGTRRRAESWVERNVARQMKLVGQKPKRVEGKGILFGEMPRRFYYEFKLGRKE